MQAEEATRGTIKGSKGLEEAAEGNGDEEEGFKAERRCRIEVGVRDDQDPEDRQQQEREKPKFPSTPHLRN